MPGPSETFFTFSNFKKAHIRRHLFLTQKDTDYFRTFVTNVLVCPYPDLEKKMYFKLVASAMFPSYFVQFTIMEFSSSILIICLTYLSLLCPDDDLFEEWDHVLFLSLYIPHQKVCI